jgi:hypothetical protein
VVEDGDPQVVAGLEAVDAGEGELDGARDHVQERAVDLLDEVAAAPVATVVGVLVGDGLELGVVPAERGQLGPLGVGEGARALVVEVDRLQVDGGAAATCDQLDVAAFALEDRDGAARTLLDHVAQGVRDHAGVGAFIVGAAAHDEARVAVPSCRCLREAAGNL